MGNIIGAILLGIIALICFVISYRQFHEKGFLFNNAYIYATEQERESMDKKPHYRQSAIVFVILGAVFLVNALEIWLQADWLVYVASGLIAAVIVYAIVSSIRIEMRKKDEKEE